VEKERTKNGKNGDIIYNGNRINIVPFLLFSFRERAVLICAALFALD
jgi:hypothetical protein